MASSPMIVLTIVTASLGFMGLIYGATIAETTFPSFEQPSSGGFFGALDALLAIIQGVWGTILFILKLITFQVPGAPWYIRLLVGATMGGAIIWSVATLFRGN